MSKIESDDFKYDIPESSKYGNQADFEGEVQLVHEDEEELDLWNEISDESFDEDNGEKKNDENAPFKKRSFKRPLQKTDRKPYNSDTKWNDTYDKKETVKSYNSSKNYNDDNTYNNRTSGYNKSYEDSQGKKGYSGSTKNYSSYGNLDNKHYNSSANVDEAEAQDHKKSGYYNKNNTNSNNNYNNNNNEKFAAEKSKNYDDNYVDYEDYGDDDNVADSNENAKSEFKNYDYGSKSGYGNRKYDKFDKYEGAEGKGNYKGSGFGRKNNDNNFESFRNKKYGGEGFNREKDFAVNQAADDNYTSGRKDNFGYKNKKDWNIFNKDKDSYINNSSKDFKDSYGNKQDGFSYRKGYNKDESSNTFKTYEKKNYDDKNNDEKSSSLKNGYYGNKYESNKNTDSYPKESLAGSNKDFSFKDKKDSGFAHESSNTNKDFGYNNKYKKESKFDTSEKGIGIHEIGAVDLKNTNEYFKNKKENLLEDTEFPRKGLFVDSSKNTATEASNYNTEKTSSRYNTGKSSFNKTNFKNNNKNYSNNNRDNNSKFSNFNNNNTRNRNERSKKNEDEDFLDLKKPVFTNSKLNQKQGNENEEKENTNKTQFNNNNEETNNQQNNQVNSTDKTKEITNNLANLSINKAALEPNSSSQSKAQINTFTSIKSESNINLSINTNTNISIASASKEIENSNPSYSKNFNQQQQQESSSNSKKKDLHIQDILIKQPNQINDDIQNIQNCQKIEIEKVMRDMNQINPQAQNPQNLNSPNNNSVFSANAHFPPMFPNSINNINNISNLQNIQINNLPNMHTPIKGMHSMHIQGIPQISNQQPNIIIPGMSPVMPNIAVNPLNFNLAGAPAHQMNPQLNAANMNNFGGQHPFYKNFNQQQQQQHFGAAPQQMNPMQFHSPQQSYHYSGQMNFNLESNQFAQQQMGNNNAGGMHQENLNLNLNANANKTINNAASLNANNSLDNSGGNNNNNYVDYGIYAGYYNATTPTNMLGVNSDSNNNNNVDGNSMIDINNTTRKLNVKAKDFIPKKKMNQVPGNKFDMPTPPIINYQNVNSYYNMGGYPNSMNQQQPMNYDSNYK